MSFISDAYKTALVFDLETTSKYASKAEIVQVALKKVFYESGEAVGSIFREELARPSSGIIPRAASEIHKITSEQVKNKPLISEIDELLSGMGKGVDVVVGHNITKYDLPIIKREMPRLYKEIENAEVFDTLLKSRKQLELESYQLGDIVSSIGLPASPTHRAGADVAASEELFNYLVKNTPKKTSRKNLVIGGAIALAGGTIGTLGYFSSPANTISSYQRRHYSSQYYGEGLRSNQFEGFSHQGLSAFSRKLNSDFGSGWRGRIRGFIGSKSGKIATAMVGGAGIIAAVLAARPYLRDDMPDGEVDLSKVRINWEDADTMLLSKSRWRFWEDPISVRIAGIDAPEIYHGFGDESLASQPWGEKSKQLMEQLAGEGKLRLFLSSQEESHGRRIGLLIQEYQKGKYRDVALEAIKRGYVAASGFESEFAPLKTYQTVEQEALLSERGIWANPYFQRYLDITEGAGGKRVTFATLSNTQRLLEDESLLKARALMESSSVEYQKYMGVAQGEQINQSGGVRFSGDKSNFNTIEGLRHGGLAALKRKWMTEFGSGYDKVRALAKMAGVSFESFLKSEHWTEAMKIARPVRTLGEGMSSFASLWETAIGTEKIMFVRKTQKEGLGEILHFAAKHNIEESARVAGRALPGPEEIEKMIPQKIEEYGWHRMLNFQNEADLLKELGTTKTVPSMYSASQKELIMEYMPGKSVSSVNKLSKQAVEDLKETASEASMRGIKNADIQAQSVHNQGNILFDPQTGRASWIDWGIAGRKQIDKEKLYAAMEEKIVRLPQAGIESREFIEAGGTAVIKKKRPNVSPAAVEMSQKIPKSPSHDIEHAATSLVRRSQLAKEKELSISLEETKLQIWDNSYNGGRKHRTFRSSAFALPAPASLPRKGR